MVGNLGNELDLIRYIFQDTQYSFIAFDPLEFRVLKILFLTEILDDKTGHSKIMPGKTREEVVCDLQMKATVDELDRWRANNI